MVIAVVLVAAAAAACGTGNAGGETTQGIKGRYVITGPGIILDCSELHPGDERDACEASNQPWVQPVAAGEIKVRDPANQLVATVITDGEGAFRVDLAAGDYLLCGAGCEGPITVMAGEFAFYEISLAVP